MAKLLKFEQKIVRKKVCWILSNILVWSRNFSKAFLEHPSLYRDILVVGTEDEVPLRRKAVRIIWKLTHSPPSGQLAYLLRENIVEFIHNVLRFESDEGVLVDAVEALLKILTRSKSLLGVFQGCENPIVQKLERIGLREIIERLIKSDTTGEEVKNRLEFLERNYLQNED